MTKILVDPNYNPNLQTPITSSTKLGVGITCAKFLGAKGSRTTFSKLYRDDFFGSVDRVQVARNLVLHAHAMNSILGNMDYVQHRLIVSEGIYAPNPRFETTEQEVATESQAQAIAQSIQGATYGQSSGQWIVQVPVYSGEVPTAGSINDLRRTGRAIVYQLIDRDGNPDPKKSFDLAEFWKDYIDYDKLTLDYDTFDPDESLNVSIILEMPEVPVDFDVSFGYGLETTYNGEVQTINELLEILPK